MSTTALTTDGRFPVRRKRPNRPSVDNAFPSSWCPHYGVRFSSQKNNVGRNPAFKVVTNVVNSGLQAKACMEHVKSTTGSRQLMERWLIVSG